METILIATDFSAAAKNATDYGVKLAKYFNARVVLVHAYPVPPTDYESGFAIDMMQSLREAGDEGLKRLKNEIEEKHHRNFHIETINEMGLAFDVITEVAKTHDADLVVMGIIGEAGKFKEHIIGSTAVNVARHSTIPTLIVPEKAHFHPIRKIAFACDLDKTEESYIVYVTKYYANLFDASLEVVNIEKPLDEFTDEKAKSSLFVEKKLESVKHKTVYATDEEAAHGLEHYLKHHPSDLVITNPKKHSLLHNLVHESTTKKLAFHLDIPLLAIH